MALVGGAGAAFLLATASGSQARPASVRTGARHLYVSSPDGTSLAATLRLPSVIATGKVAGVLIIPEPWAADRDGRQQEIGLTNSPYRVLADRLAERGIASLRYDQRGVGDTQVGPGATIGGLFEIQQDAVAAYFALARQPELDRARIAVVGHGAGGLVGMSMFGTDGAPAALAVIDTPGRSFGDEIRDHLQAHVLPAFGARAPDLLAQYDAAVVQLKATGQAPKVDGALAAYFPPAHAKLLDDLYHASPAGLAAAVQAPVLIFNGRLDDEITVADAKGLAAAFKQAPHDLVVGDFTGHNLEVLPDLAADPTHSAQMSRTATRDTDVPAIASITDWLAAHLGQGR
ncbi:MAG: alpha/beta hydrolase [Candidatus Dormibacteraceae bacterium]